jgi:hypothetical protein
MLGLIAHENATLKTKMKKIILVAFESYCYYCLTNIKEMPEIKLNLFAILKHLLIL